MGKGEFLGEFEQLVILALLRLGKDGYGMNVRRELERTAGRNVTFGTVYGTLDRLEEKGSITVKELLRVMTQREPWSNSAVYYVI